LPIGGNAAVPDERAPLDRTPGEPALVKSNTAAWAGPTGDTGGMLADKTDFAFMLTDDASAVPCGAGLSGR
jgi:hypothetical protein